MPSNINLRTIVHCIRCSLWYSGGSSVFVRIYFVSLFSVLRKQKRRIRLCKYDSKSVTFSGSTRWMQILYFSNVLETEILTLKGGKRVNCMRNQAATYANILFNVLFFSESSTHSDFATTDGSIYSEHTTLQFLFTMRFVHTLWALASPVRRPP